MNSVRTVYEGAARDVETWDNGSGSAWVVNQLVFKAGETNHGMVGVCLEAIANGASGRVRIKGEVQLPAAAAVITQGYCVQAATDSTSCTVSGTDSGLYAVGRCLETIATSTGYVKVALNEGPSAFYVW